jgi:serine/threonine protein kinase
MSAAAGDAPSRIGRFEIRREIGRGTMGVVYEAHDPVLGRTVALKTIALMAAGAPPERAAFEQRFLAEARIAARLSHPGIVVIHDVGRDAGSGTLYMAMEHLSGRTLEEVVGQGQAMEWRQALGILARIAAALHHAHAQGVVHRDVKPANVMLQASGEPKIMDFGIAKLVVEGHATTTGSLLGTPLYMAPEQALGEAVDARTDIFSLGAIAYSLLTGRKAFEARSIPTILARVLHHHPVPPSTVVAALPPAVDDLVTRAMAKSPAARYPTALAMADDIEDILGGRTPRHRADWTPPAVGATTLVSAGAEELQELELIEGPPLAAKPEPRGHRSDPRPRFLAMILLGGGIGIAAAGLLRFEILPPEERTAVLPPATRPEWLPTPEGPAPSPSSSPADATALPSPATQAASPSPDAVARAEAQPNPPSESLLPVESSPDGTVGSPSPEAAPSPEAPSAVPPSPEPLVASAAPQGPTPAVPSASPSPRPKEAEKRSPDPKEKARLAVHLDPALQARSLRVWVDGKLLADEKLDAGVARKAPARADIPVKVVPLSPGRRQVRVQVRTEEGLRGERLLATFKAGVSRRLDVKAGRGASALSFVLR